MTLAGEVPVHENAARRPTTVPGVPSGDGTGLTGSIQIRRKSGIRDGASPVGEPDTLTKHIPASSLRQDTEPAQPATRREIRKPAGLFTREVADPGESVYPLL